MKWYGLIDTFSFWGLFVTTIAALLLFYEGGFRVGRWRGRQKGHEPEVVVRAMVASMTSLMTFILALMFWIGTTHYDSVRQARLNEANAIRNVYLRSDLLPEPNRMEIRNLLREYVDIRLEAFRSMKFDQAITQSEVLQNLLWSQTIAAKEKTSSPIFVGYFIQSLNEMVALHTRRIVVGIEYRIPDAVWIALYLISALSAASLGYHGGLNETRRSLVVPAFAMIFSLAMVMIADLDRPLTGSLRVSQEVLIDIRRSMNPP